MFFKKKETKNNNLLTKVCSLLIHAAKIDENYFKYSPNKRFKKISPKKISDENPFKILKNLNLN